MKITKRIFVCILAVTALAAGRAAAAGDPVALRLNFNKGDVYNYAFNVDITGEAGIRPPEDTPVPADLLAFPLDMSTYTELEIEVTDSDAAKGAALEMFVTRVRGTFSFQDNTQTYDSDTDENVMNGDLMDKPTTLRVLPNAAVSDLNLPGITDMEVFMPLPPEFDIGKMLSQMMFTLPDKPVAPGDEWEQKRTMEIPGDPAIKITIPYKFKFIGFEKVKEIDCAVLAVSVNEDFSSQVDTWNIPLPAFDAIDCEVEDCDEDMLSAIADEEASGDTETLPITFEKLALTVDGKIYLAHKQGVLVGAEAAVDTDVLMSVEVPEGEEDEVFHGRVGFGVSASMDVSVNLQ